MQYRYWIFSPLAEESVGVFFVKIKLEIRPAMHEVTPLTVRKLSALAPWKRKGTGFFHRDDFLFFYPKKRQTALVLVCLSRVKRLSYRGPKYLIP